jgi:hypothetical protein
MVKVSNDYNYLDEVMVACFHEEDEETGSDERKRSAVRR